MSNPTYANIFNILKPIEAMTERKSGYFSFSASGKDQNLTFRLQFSGNDRGAIKYELLEEGERASLEHMLVSGRPNCIIDKDVTAIAEQMAVLEVSKGVTDVIVAIVEGLRRMEVVAPVFALNKAVDAKNTNRAEYVFGIAAYLLDDQYQPVGRISLSITVFKMSQLEKTAMLIRQANAERDAEEAGIAKDVVVTDGGNERYKITAMIRPGSPAMEQLMAKEQLTKATTEFAELVNNKLPLNTLHGMKDIIGEAVTMDPALMDALNAKAPQFTENALDNGSRGTENLRQFATEQWEAHGFVSPVATSGGYEGTVKANVPDEADGYVFGNETTSMDPAFAEYAEQTKRLLITPDPTADLGYTTTVQNGDMGVVDPNHVVK
jgi:hypothetical protein